MTDSFPEPYLHQTSGNGPWIVVGRVKGQALGACGAETREEALAWWSKRYPEELKRMEEQEMQDEKDARYWRGRL